MDTLHFCAAGLCLINISLSHATYFTSNLLDSEVVITTSRVNETS